MIEVLDYTEHGEVRVFMGTGFNQEVINCTKVERPNDRIALGYIDEELVVVIINVDGVK